jgi:hypothetical protein
MKYATAFTGGVQLRGFENIGNIAVDIEGSGDYSRGNFVGGILNSYDNNGYIIISDTTTSDLVGRTTGGGGIGARDDVPTFWVSKLKTDISFLNLVNNLPVRKALRESNFANNANDLFLACDWLLQNGYWTSYKAESIVDNATLVVYNSPNFDIPAYQGVNRNSDFTIEWWARLDVDNNSVAWSIGSNLTHAVSIESGIMNYWIDGSVALSAQLPQPYLGNWSYFTVNRYKDSMGIFQDGTALNYGPYSDAIPTGGLPLYLGSKGDDGVFKGKMSNFRWSNKTLRSIPGNSFTPPTAPLNALNSTKLLIFQGIELSGQIRDRSIRRRKYAIINDSGVYDSSNPFFGVQGSIDFSYLKVLTFKVDNTSGTAGGATGSQYTGVSGFEMYVNWGDGSNIQYYPLNSTQLISHRFPVAGGIFNVKAYVKDPTNINYIDNSVDNGNFQMLEVDYSRLINVTYINLNGNNLSSTQLNKILSELVANGLSGGALDISNQTTFARPTGQGLIDKDTLISRGWTVEIDNFVAITFNTSRTYINIGGSNNFTFTTNWGDGTPVEVSSDGSDWYPYHIYTIAPTTAKFEFSDNTLITYLQISDQPDDYIDGDISHIYNLDLLTQLVYLIIADNNQLTTFDSLLPDSITYLNLGNNKLTTFDTVLPTSLTYLNLSYNQLTTLDSLLPDSLTTLNLSYNQLTTLDSLLPDSLTTLNLSHNQLNQNSLNNILIGLSASGTTDGTVNLTNQTPASCPIGDGIVAHDYLTNTLNWNVLLDIDCYPYVFEILFDTNLGYTSSYFDDELQITYYYSILGDFTHNHGYCLIQALTATKVIVDYGDGSPYQITNNENVYLSNHYYQYSSGIKTIKVALSDPTLFNYITIFDDPGIVGINNLNLFTSLQSITINNGTSLYQSSVNYILTTLAGMTFSNGNIFLDNQTEGSCPSGDGILAKNYLLGLNNNIRTDSCPLLTIDLDVTTLLSPSMGATFSGDNSFDLSVNWGDGSTSAYTGNNIVINKLYSQLGTYSVTISVNRRVYIKNINFAPTNTITSIGEFNSLTYLNYLNVEGNKLSSLPTLSNSITYLNLSGNKFDTEAIENTINSFTGYTWETPSIDLRSQQSPEEGRLQNTTQSQIYATSSYSTYVSLTGTGWTIYVDYAPYSPITLSYNSEVCDIYNTLFTEHYFDNNLGVSVGSFLYLDDLGNTVAPNGYYARRNEQIIVVSGGTGEITEIRGCNIQYLGLETLPLSLGPCDDVYEGDDYYSKNGLMTLGETVYRLIGFSVNGVYYERLTRWYATAAISIDGRAFYAMNNGIIGPYLGNCG